MALITGRAARRTLVASGVRDTSAREALRAGLAGGPTRQGRAQLFDRESVLSLCDRRVVHEGELRAAVLAGEPPRLLVLRRFVDLTAPEEAQRRQVGADWKLGDLSAAFLNVFVSMGEVGTLVTVGDFVLRAFNLAGASFEAQPGRCRLWFAEPGAWSRQFDAIRLPLGSGPAHFLLDQGRLEHDQSVRKAAAKRAADRASPDATRRRAPLQPSPEEAAHPPRREPL